MKTGVIYVSKIMRSSQIATNNQAFFPFLNSHLFNAESKSRLSFDKIQAMCNYQNIRQHLKKKQSQISKNFLFFGRSNVGKSSLINELIGTPVNQVSKQPGKTKDLAFLKLNTRQLCYFVDAPGYGYASSASKKQIGEWGKLVQMYLKNTSEQGQQIMTLLDINHGIKNLDMMLFDLLKHYKKNFIVVFTKCDKSNKDTQQNGRQLAIKLQEKYSNMNYYVHFTSSRTHFGIDELRNHILFKIIDTKSDQNTKK